MKRILLVAGGVALLVLLFVVLRGSGEDGNEASTQPRTAFTPTTAAGRTGTTTTPLRTTKATSTGPIRVRVNVRVGSGNAPRRLKAREGRRLVLIITADVSDHVHVHGYDRLADVRPGRPARISLRLTIPGIFEIELEEHGLLIAELEVRP